MKKKTLKGMTLMEVIIAIAVFAVFGVILVTAGTTIDNLTKATTNLKKKVTMQSPYAANQLKSYLPQDGSPSKELTGVPLADDIKVSVPSSSDTNTYKLKNNQSGDFATVGSQYSYSFDRNDVMWKATVLFDSTSRFTCEVYDDNNFLKLKKSYNANDFDWKSLPFFNDNAKVYVSDVVANGNKVHGGDKGPDGSETIIEFKNTYAPGVVQGVKYSTKEIYDDKMQGKTSPYNNGLNLQYIEVGNYVTPTEPTTESTP